MAKPDLHREHWGGAIGFVLATAGSAIGLGNIWKFPYITGLNGGGAFVLVYILCIFLISAPVMLCEMLIGRKTQRNAYGAIKELQRGRNDRLARVFSVILSISAVFALFNGDYLPGGIALIFAVLFFTMKFAIVGFCSIFAGAAILSYYGMIGGWAFMYVLKMFRGEFSFSKNLYQSSSPEALGALTDQAQNVFNMFTDNWLLSAGFMALFMLIPILVVAGGIKKGIERASKILMPIMFLLLLAMIIRGINLPRAEKGVAFFLNPDFSKLTAGGIFEALGHAFYSSSLGMAVVITYGSYLSPKQNLFKSSFFIIILDAFASVMAGLAIFPAVFAMGFSPGAGPGLIFKVLPATFGSFPGNTGWLWGGLFFIMLSIAALTSAISILEPCVAFLIDEIKWKRVKAAWTAGLTIMALGVLSCLSFSNWDNLAGLKNTLVKLGSEEWVRGSYFELLDYICSNWMLPLNGLLVAVFVGWVWGAGRAANELRRGSEEMSDVNLLRSCLGFKGGKVSEYNRQSGLSLLSLWIFMVKFVIPLVVLLIFLRAIGFSLGVA